MKLIRRLKSKYGIAHPLCMLSLLTCFGLCAGIVFSTLGRSDMPVASNGISVASDTSVAEVSMEEWKGFGEEVFDTVVRSYSQTIAIGIEPVFAVTIQGIAGLVNAMLGLPLDLNLTFFSLPHVLMIMVVLCCVGKIMQCFECTRSFAMLTYGELERLFGYAMMIYMAGQNVVKLIYICEKHDAMLERLLAGLPAEFIVCAFVLGLGTLSAFGGILIFYIIKTLVLGLQIMQLSISFFPFTSFVFEVIRSGVVVLFAVFNLLFPRVGFAFNCAAFLVGIILLSQTSSSVEYFRVVYVETIVLPIYRFRGTMAELRKEAPADIRKKLHHKDNVLIPVFTMDKFKVGDLEIDGHEKWWMEITDTELYFYHKKPLSTHVEIFTLPRNEKRWYFKDNWRYLELFDLNGPEENIIRLFQKPERQIGFVVSREYEALFREITHEMGAVDYNALKAELLAERKQYMEEHNQGYNAVM